MGRSGSRKVIGASHTSFQSWRMKMRPSFLLMKTDTCSARRLASSTSSRGSLAGGDGALPGLDGIERGGRLGGVAVRASSSAACARATPTARRPCPPRRSCPSLRVWLQPAGPRGGDTRVDRGDRRLRGRHGGLRLAHVLDGLTRFGAGSLGNGEGILGGLVGDGLVGDGTLLERGGVGDRVERRGGIGRRGHLGHRGGGHRRCLRSHAGEFDRRRRREPQLAGRRPACGSRLHLRQRQQRVGELDRRDVARRDDDAGAHLGHAEELRAKPAGRRMQPCEAG